MLGDDELLIGGWQVMQRWEEPLMHALANEVTATQGDVLEIGFGMGIAASAITERGCTSYTVIEAHPKVAELARDWASSQAVPVKVVEGFWQELVPTIGADYDGILFDTFPMSRRERRRNHFEFIPHAPGLLRPGGVLTHYSDETIDFRPEHLRLLLDYFDEVKLLKVTGLRPTADCEYWHDSTMVVPIARKNG